MQGFGRGHSRSPYPPLGILASIRQIPTLYVRGAAARLSTIALRLPSIPVL
jgi:hypothetical protein